MGPRPRPRRPAGLGPFVSRNTCPASGWCSPATRAISERPPTARRCRISIVASWRSCRTRTPSCSGSKRGRLDTTTTSPPEAYAPLKRAADAGLVKLFDLGVAYYADASGSTSSPARLPGSARAWLQRDELRRRSRWRSIGSLSPARCSSARPAGLRPGTPANKKWYWAGLPQPPTIRPRAKRLLASIGLTDATATGCSRMPYGRPADSPCHPERAAEPGARRGGIREELTKIRVASTSWR